MIVKKRNGQTENFTLSKLRKSLIAAGLNENLAGGVCGEIEHWVPQEAEGGIIDSLFLREKVIELLEMYDQETARRYQDYPRHKPSE